MFEARFQSFEDHAERAASAQHVKALRTELARRNLTGFIVPRADRHQNEYVPASEERHAWLTGFTGSAGAAVVLMERAALFTDGRYTLQAREQVDTTVFEIVHLVETPPDQWLEKNLARGDRLGYDPWLHTVESAEKLAKACAAAGATLVPVEPDPVDAIWSDRPAPPLGAVTLHDEINSRPVSLTLDQIHVAAKNLSNLPGTNLTADVSLRWNTNGIIKTELTASTAPMSGPQTSRGFSALSSASQIAWMTLPSGTRPMCGGSPAWMTPSTLVASSAELA
jgi:hypothetical protein